MRSSADFGCFFITQVFLPFNYRSDETVLGLLGSPNGVRGDDWVSPDGSPFDPPADQAESIFGRAYDYCVTNWCIRDPDSSIFTYPEGESFDSFFGCDEDYSNEIEQAVKAAEVDLRSICGTDLSCLVDGICGSLADAEAALEDSASIEAEQQDGNPLQQDSDGNFLGTFSGMVTQNTRVYPVTIEYFADGIRTLYGTLGCGNTLPIPVFATGPGRIEWIERIEFGRNCINGGIVTLTQTEGEEFLWEYFWRKGSVTVAGTLSLEPSSVI